MVDDSGNVFRYFTCENNKGSLVKPEKVAKQLTFLEAYKAKYDARNPQLPTAHQPYLVFGDSSSRIIGLDSSDIGRLDFEEKNQIEREFYTTEVLDVSCTLFIYWEEILELASWFVNLKVLICSDNGFLTFENLNENRRYILFPKLEILVLNKCNPVSVESLLTQTQVFPNLTALYISNCQLTHVPLNISSALKKLDLSFNLLGVLDDEQLRRIPKDLIWLNLNNNPCSFNPNLKFRFVSLETLFIEHNDSLSTWKRLETISEFCLNFLSRIYFCPI